MASISNGPGIYLLRTIQHGAIQQTEKVVIHH